MYINGWNREKVMAQIRAKNLGFQSSDVYGNCFYRQDIGGQTNCCLVGAFIPDDKYCEAMEEIEAKKVIKDFDLEGDMPMKASMMDLLQNFHDTELDIYDGEEFFTEIEKLLIRMEN